MTILNLGTYPPKQCGIATFSWDLKNSLNLNGNEVAVMAVSDDSYRYSYPEEVVFNIRQNRKQDYIKAAAFANGNQSVEMLILQHEYGIYGGKDGQYILELVKLLHKPYVLITHTVLPQPSKNQKQILNLLCHRAAGIVCMTQKSANLLQDLYEAPAELINVIAHGVPQFAKTPPEELKARYNLTDKTVVSTFGLIGPGKGLELGIKAIAELVPDYPMIRYLILGQTHPMLQKYEGEKYRSMLMDLVAQLKLEEHVIFVNKFLSDEELGDYLNMTDIYLSPYPNKDQAVSGTMAFALGCGLAIVSTSYAYARETLQGGRGLLAREADAGELAALMKMILDNPQIKEELKANAYKLGNSWTWPNVGRQYTAFFKRIISDTRLQEESTVNYAKL